ncbi:MAG: SDR family oxidoreductase [Deltaproteobacteria bacterium]|nr:SDR family oxidoreductase [Deltaproteobacteria bacterium]
MADWPPNLPDMTGKVVLVTGANTGLGLVTAQELARAGARVHMACRNQDKARAAMETIRAEVPNADLELLPLDLASLDSLRASAEAWLAKGEPLHVLVSNAGLVTRGLTADGFELTFGVNHIGTAAFTFALLDRLKESAPSRIVTVASRAHMRTKGIEFDQVRTSTRSTTAFPEYSQSKLANVYFSAELGRRLEGTGVTTYAVHPGAVATDVWRRVPWGFRHLMKMFMITTEVGTLTQLYCSTAPELANETSNYYAKSKAAAPRGRGNDRAHSDALWAKTEEWIGPLEGAPQASA